ncbi:hypothetical protein Mgra_00006865 [Meloidogyne graminicola]|uniref:Uncharacterized protein n=1 Tax=Meloidogyne graminicola TaxID=189291 RepID=A0A8S9ZKL6_9BILA|nr:hypothetical protein Mgra_00006865 [Meloidogyne graminicola]
MFGKRIILFLFPLLIIFIKFCFTNEIKQLTKKNSLITDEEIKEDIKVVDLAIQAPWVEQNPLGIQRMETKREYFGLSDAQKALFNRHWELETIQEIKDIKEEQNNNIIQEESNETEIFDQIQKRKYPFRAERPSEMVLIDMNSNGKDFGWNSEENEEEEEEEEEKVKPMVEVVEIIDINKEKEREEEDESIIINSSSTSEEEEEIKKEIQPQPNGILNVLSNILFGGNNRFKRETIPLQIIQNSTKIDNNNNINEYITIKGKNFEFSASKMEIIKDLNKKEEKSENKKLFIK